MFSLYAYSFQRGLKYQSSIPTPIPKQVNLGRLFLYRTIGAVCHTPCEGLKSGRLPFSGSLGRKQNREMAQGRKREY